jgi:hypothetical protein
VGCGATSGSLLFYVAYGCVVMMYWIKLTCILEVMWLDPVRIIVVELFLE